MTLEIRLMTSHAKKGMPKICAVSIIDAARNFRDWSHAGRGDDQSEARSRYKRRTASARSAQTMFWLVALFAVAAVDVVVAGRFVFQYSTGFARSPSSDDRPFTDNLIQRQFHSATFIARQFHRSASDNFIARSSVHRQSHSATISLS